MKKFLIFTGRILVNFVALYYLVVLILGVIFDSSQNWNLESLGIVILSMLTVISAIYIWIRLKPGVWVVLIVGLLFSSFAYITAGRHQLMAVMISGGPLLFGGLLALLGSLVRTEKTDTE